MSEVCPAHEATLKHLEHFQDNQKEIMKLISDMREKAIITEQSTKSAHHRIDNQAKQTEAIVKMSASVEHMAKQVEELILTTKQQNERIDKIERAPGDRAVSWNRLIGTTAVACVVSAVVGFVISHVTMGVL